MLPLASIHRRLEVGDVSRDVIAIQTDILTGSREGVAAQRLVDSVDRIGQQPSSALSIGVRPEEGDELVATSIETSRGREERQERESVALRRTSGDRAGRRDERWSTEQPEAIHRMLTDDNRTTIRRCSGEIEAMASAHLARGCLAHGPSADRAPSTIISDNLEEL
jgi:hypothetical protein